MINEIPSSNNDDINLRPLRNKVIRNKFLIIFLTSFSTIFSIAYALLATPIYKGGFRIVVETKKDVSSLSQNLLVLSNKNKNKTEEFILNSPSVLKPVYNFAKNHYLKRGEKVDDLSYNKWSKKSLNIEFEKGTNVLNIDFIDKDKAFILETLSLISNKYQNYSKQEREKFLINTINFLTNQQKILESKHKISLKKLNEFSIENGLGDIDGFVSLKNSRTDIDYLQGGKNQKGNAANDISKLLNESQARLLGTSSKKSFDGGQRFTNQFKLLERYESFYLDYSSKLDPKSDLLRDLKTKIDNLRESLKRPNEILVKYKELTKISDRDENVLSQVENELIMTKLELARQRDPWELISQPTIYDGKFAPQGKEIIITAFLFSLLLGLIISYIKEYKSGIIYELSDLKKNISCQYLETLYIKNKSISSQLIQKIFEINNLQEKNPKLGLINFVYENNNLIKSFNTNKTKRKFETIYLKDELEIENYTSIAFIVFQNKVEKKNILLMNKYTKLFNDKIIGWFFVDEDYDF